MHYLVEALFLLGFIAVLFGVILLSRKSRESCASKPMAIRKPKPQEIETAPDWGNYDTPTCLRRGWRAPEPASSTFTSTDQAELASLLQQMQGGSFEVVA